MKVFSTGLLVCLIVFVASEPFDHGPAGTEIREATYRYLQRVMRPINGNFIKIQIVDIRSIQPPQRGDATPRDQLESLVDKIADTQPVAIGIDIDFSADADHFAKGDVKFFSRCLDMCKQHIPVFLGVNRVIDYGSEPPLGFANFSQLAATLLTKTDAQRYVVQLGSDPSGLKSMVSRLAQAWMNRDQVNAGCVSDNAADATCRPSHPWPNWLEGPLCSPRTVDKSKESPAIQLATQSLIDYSGIRDLKPIRVEELDYHLAELHRSIVLIGDAEPLEASDVFVNPVASGTTMGGIYILAAGIYSKATAPLCEIECEKDKTVDSSLALCGVLIETLGALVFGKRLYKHHLGKAVSLGLATTVVILGLTVNYSRIFWAGFVLVALALLVHPYLQDGLERTIPFLGKKFKGYLLKR